MPIPCAVLGTGNIGTDLMYKLMQSDVLDVRAMVGIDPESEGLRIARSLGLEATAEGVAWLLARRDQYGLVLEATSATAHRQHAPLLRDASLRTLDLTPAAIGPSVVPGVNLTEHLQELNLNLITCGGQATIPIVAAVTRVCSVPYAEIISTIASRSAGPGTRSNIDEFTQRTSACLESIGGAAKGKAIIILNPAEPSIMMRNTVYCALPTHFDEAAVTTAITEMATAVARYVPGYRLKSPPIIDRGPFRTPQGDYPARVTALLEVAGAGHYLPAYAGNLDIMTSAAVRVGEAWVGSLEGGAAR
jgi:acetaldehyde dehydrogenase